MGDDLKAKAATSEQIRRLRGQRATWVRAFGRVAQHRTPHAVRTPRFPANRPHQPALIHERVGALPLYRKTCAREVKAVIVLPDMLCHMPRSTSTPVAPHHTA